MKSSKPAEKPVRRAPPKPERPYVPPKIRKLGRVGLTPKTRGQRTFALQDSSDPPP